MMICLLFVSGCKSSPEIIDSLCLSLRPIIITEEELNEKLTDETLRQIDNFNQEWVTKCG